MFELIYDTDVRQHLAAIDRKYHSLIRETIEEQLSYEPVIESRNRKPLVRPTDINAAWELRFGPNNQFQVFYRADESAQQVYILAIGMKVRNQLLVGGEKFEL